MLRFHFTALYILLLSVSLVNSQSVEFYKEDLRFEITKDYFKVTGQYYFRNKTTDTIRKYLLYPFPAEETYGEVDSIRILNVSAGETDNNLLGRNSKGAYYIVVIDPKETVQYEISYIQKTLSNKVKYILLTMNTWRNKLEEASFTLYYPRDIIIDSINFIPQNVFVNDDRVIWQWNYEDYMPDKDVDIYLR